MSIKEKLAFYLQRGSVSVILCMYTVIESFDGCGNGVNVPVRILNKGKSIK